MGFHLSLVFIHRVLGISLALARTFPFPVSVYDVCRNRRAPLSTDLLITKEAKGRIKS
jgi:hypothetical protein